MNELQILENYRALYHQIQFLVQLLKLRNREQQLSIHNQILNRIKQILEMKDVNNWKCSELLSLSIIQCLEEILQIEKGDIRDLYAHLKLLVEYLAHLNDFLANCSQQVILGEVILDVGLMNKQIIDCSDKVRKIVKYHKDYFEQQLSFKDKLLQLTNNVNESVTLLSEIIGITARIKIQKVII